jgi:hypothetical protein
MLPWQAVEVLEFRNIAKTGEVGRPSPKMTLTPGVSLFSTRSAGFVHRRFRRWDPPCFINGSKERLALKQGQAVQPVCPALLFPFDALALAEGDAKVAIATCKHPRLGSQTSASRADDHCNSP